MGNIKKKKLDKHFKKVYDKKRKGKTLKKEIQERVKAIFIEELEKDGELGRIVIENVSIEIFSENPEAMVSSAGSGSNTTTGSGSNTTTNCYYYCYVILGQRICRKICW
jgi:hypothetical protein